MTRLQNAHDALMRWCERNYVTMSSICDEDDLLGYLVPRQYSSLTPRLSRFIEKVALNYNLCYKEQHTRSGTVYALSIKAITETTFAALIPTDDQSRLARRLDLIFDNLLPSQAIQETQHSLQPTQVISIRLARKLKEGIGYISTSAVVKEALDGLAADYQPIDVLKQFEAALRDLGILDSLNAANVTNRLSRDKQVIHFYITDMEGREREIASYELVKLAEGSNMEQAIKDLLDMSKKRAPGTTDREAEHIKDREQQIRNVAKQYSPEEQAQEMQNQMAQGQTTPIVANNNIPVENTKTTLDKLFED